MTTYCDFDEGVKHQAEAEYLLSKRNEAGKFNRQTALCARHLVDYALSAFRWQAIYFQKAVICCHFHMRERQAELEVTNVAALDAACYFCLGGK